MGGMWKYSRWFHHHMSAKPGGMHKTAVYGGIWGAEIV